MSKSYIERSADAVEAQMKSILPMLRLGHTRSATAKAVGLKPTQFFDVIRTGKNKRGKCHDILVAVLKAESIAQVALEKIVIEDAKVNVKTAQWLLARRFRLKERHEPEIDILRKLDFNKLAQEEVKLELLGEKLRLLREKSGEDMTADDWRAIMTEAKDTNARIKSIH